ncbi:RHS repeat-associated core domain-containing protein [Flavobacterium columnare]|uniref:RHS repeat-associated core domain-containing protein n=1 Tax=Flavobacterium columnare TaxID=996 RepID=UPI002989FB04|nr:RHS repeat-associated core domain-containing protein [Flavobacterium columnare]
MYGKTRKIEGDQNLIPFLYQGQYYDHDIELAYNRFRYYNPETGTYISQDPIGLLGNNPTFYAYVHDSNSWVDPFGLSSNPLSVVNFTDSAGTSLQVNGYTDISHLSDKELTSLYYANKRSGFGLSPKDKQGNVIVLHHYKQNANGPIVAMPAKHHDKKHTNPGQHPFGKTKGGGLTKAERDAFDNWRKEYHTHLAETELNKRGIKCK